MSDCDIYLKEEEGLTVREKQSKRGFILNDLMALSLNEKIELSRAIIRESVDNTKDREQIVACSFGKDSIVLLDLVRQVTKDVKVVFNNTGVEFPETLKFKDEIVKNWDLDYTELRASDFTFKDKNGNKQKATFWNIVREYGFPGTSTESRAKKKHKCCYYLKEKPMFQFIKNKNVTLYIGFVGDEGQYRRWLFIQKGDFNYYSKNWNAFKSAPLLFWLSDDIFNYIKLKNLPLNPVYKKYGILRQGCMPCTGHIGWKKQIHKINPKLLEKILHEMGQTTLGDFE